MTDTGKKYACVLETVVLRKIKFGISWLQSFSMNHSYH